MNNDVRQVLAGPSIAHPATAGPDGAPHSTPVIVGTRGDQLVFFTGPNTRKARNLRNDPRVAISITPVDNPFSPVVVRGRVIDWIDGDDAWGIIDPIQIKY